MLDQSIMKQQVGNFSYNENKTDTTDTTDTTGTTDSKENKDKQGNKEESRKVRNQRAGYRLCSLLLDRSPGEFLKELELLSSNKDYTKEDFDYFLNEMRYTWGDDALVATVADLGYLDIVKILVEKHNVDINAVSITNGKKDTIDTKTALFYACGRNNLAIIDYLMSNGANPTNPYLGVALGNSGSVEGLKMILNLDGKYKYSWD